MKSEKVTSEAVLHHSWIHWPRGNCQHAPPNGATLPIKPQQLRVTFVPLLRRVLEPGNEKVLGDEGLTQVQKLVKIGLKDHQIEKLKAATEEDVYDFLRRELANILCPFALGEEAERAARRAAFDDEVVEAISQGTSSPPPSPDSDEEAKEAAALKG